MDSGEASLFDNFDY